MAVQSPALGYNTNVRHGGKLFHIQTEDSGVRHPHVITHLFADGGRIVATRKSSYAEHLGAEKLQDIVKTLMREQHKAMFISLRDGEFDEEGATVAAPEAPAPDVGSIPPGADTIPPPSDGGRHSYQSALPAGVLSTTEAPSSAAFTRPAHANMTLDEVILSYLAEDLEAQDKT